MATVSRQSSIERFERAKKLIRSKIQETFEPSPEKKQMAHSSSSKNSTSPQKQPRSTAKIFETLVARPARRTASFVRLKQSRTAENHGPKPTLGDRFFALPTELQLEVVNRLFFYDILNLRTTSRKFRRLTTQHEHHIVRHHIKVWVPRHITELYPPSTHTPSLRYLTELAHKQQVSTELASKLAQQILKEMMPGGCRRGRRSNRFPGRRSDHRFSECAKLQWLSQLEAGMAPLLFALFHFLETYRNRRLDRLDDHCRRVGDYSWEETGCKELQSDILSQYPDRLLLKVHQMYLLLLHLLFRRLTPSSLSLARLKGQWNLNRPSNEVFARLLVLGGIEKVCALYKLKGYLRRRKSLEKYIKKLDKQREKDQLDDWGLVDDHHQSQKRASPSLERLARLDADNLMEIWTPAAEDRLLEREIVNNLNEIGCFGRFVSQMLGGLEGEDDEDEDEDEDGEDDEDDEDDVDSEDGEDSADDAPAVAAIVVPIVGYTTAGPESLLEDDFVTMQDDEEDGEQEEGEDEVEMKEFGSDDAEREKARDVDININAPPTPPLDGPITTTTTTTTTTTLSVAAGLMTLNGIHQGNIA